MDWSEALKLSYIVSALGIAVILSSCLNTATVSPKVISIASSSPANIASNSPTNAVNTASLVQPEVVEATIKHTDSLVLYELDPAWFEKATSEIPNYSKGNIDYFDQKEVDSFNQGHSVTWSDPLVRTLLNISNLIPDDYLLDPEIADQLSTGLGKDGKPRRLITKKGIVFTQVEWNTITHNGSVDIVVPNGVKYEVTLRFGSDSNIMIIQKIAQIR
ncbi:MAG: hypothetical protein K6T85_17520 [Gorillibacterium sp.]|nr:hypothetical protein [Gorillibacterium sp.]